MMYSDSINLNKKYLIFLSNELDKNPKIGLPGLAANTKVFPVVDIKLSIKEIALKSIVLVATWENFVFEWRQYILITESPSEISFKIHKKLYSLIKDAIENSINKDELINNIFKN